MTDANTAYLRALDALVVDRWTRNVGAAGGVAPGDAVTADAWTQLVEAARVAGLADGRSVEFTDDYVLRLEAAAEKVKPAIRSAGDFEYWLQLYLFPDPPRYEPEESEVVGQRLTWGARVNALFALFVAKVDTWRADHTAW